jgi:8-oxo-dGTP pyrophosphatase MutT (NUDIX family)
VDAADKDPVAAAARELTEETGYTAENLRLLPSLSPNRAAQTNRVHVVLAQPARHTGPAAPKPGENITLVRVLVSKAPAMSPAGGIAHAQHVGPLMMGLKAANLL